MKTIFITIYDGTIAKNLLRTKVLEVLKTKLKIVLLVRQEKKEYYQKEFGSKNVIIKPLPPFKGGEKIGRLFYYVCLYGIHTETSRIRNMTSLKRNRHYPLFLIKQTFWFLGQFRLWRELLRKIYFFIPSGRFEEILNTYKPDLVFATGMLSIEDNQLLKEAKKREIKTLGMVKSWDNLVSNTFILVKPDKLIVHNNIIKNEAIVLCDYPSQNIFVSGIPQYDIYIDKDTFLAREEFFKKIKADPSKKLILFCEGGDFFCPDDPEILEILNQAVKTKKIKTPSQILARSHPKYPGFDGIAKRNNGIILDRPGKHILNSLGHWEFERDDILHLANSLYHADLVINTCSTMTLEACVFDKPVITIAFDGFHKRDFYQSVKRLSSFTHYQKVVRTGGIRLVENSNQLIEMVNTYLSNPKLEQEGRKRIRDEQCYKLDGKSGERIAKFILKLIY
ncbi:MAG: CDP-glycerol glycerophosphotransferase family protein [Candidatus Paceibacterales bacterium]